MPIALVKAGAVSRASAASVSPAFGQATTAGNLLVACVSAAATTTITVNDGTWSLATGSAGVSTVGAIIFYKANCGATETAPTFSCSGATFMAAVLTEWSGAATSSPLDQASSQGSVTGTNSPNAQNNVSDANTDDLAIAAFAYICSKSATATFAESWAPTGGTAAVIGGDGSTKDSHHFNAVSYLLGGNGGSAVDQNTETITLSTGTTNTANANIASFKVAPSSPVMRNPLVLQAVNRSANF